MKESAIQTLFSKVCKTKGVFELKLAKGPSLPYNAVKPHQIQALLQAQTSLFYKIPDAPIFRGMKNRFIPPKPFDCLLLQDYPAFVAICFYKPRQKKELLLINIQDFINFRDTDTRKSLTEENARRIASEIIKL